MNGLDSFRNTRDTDIEDFLRFKSLEFEKRHWCATYLLVDMEAFDKNVLKIEGYFTLSNKVLSIANDVSKSKRKKLFNGIQNGDTSLHVILIGQLAKYIDETVSPHLYGNTSMNELLDMAFEIIESVNNKIPCRCVLLECRDVDKEDTGKQKRIDLHKKYQECGFVPLQKDGDLIQYIALI